MNLTKLNARGVAHEFLIVGVLVIFSIVGIGYMVAGNANPSGGKAAAGDAIQGGGVNGPAKGTTLTCAIDSLPTTGTYKELLKPYVRIKNEGSVTYTGTANYGLSYFGADGKQIKASSGGRDLIIKKGKTVKIPLPKYRVAYAKSGSITKLHYSAQVEGLGWCNNTWVELPKNPKATTKAPATTKPKTTAPKPTSSGGSITGGGEG